MGIPSYGVAYYVYAVVGVAVAVVQGSYNKDPTYAVAVVAAAVVARDIAFACTCLKKLNTRILNVVKIHLYIIPKFLVFTKLHFAVLHIRPMTSLKSPIFI